MERQPVGGRATGQCAYGSRLERQLLDLVARQLRGGVLAAPAELAVADEPVNRCNVGAEDSGGPSSIDKAGVAHRVRVSARAHESRADIISGYQLACEHADATIEALPIDTPGHVPWWPRPDAKLLNVMVHVLTETNRHLGHADILREQLDGALGSDPTPLSPQDEAEWATHRPEVEKAAQASRSEH